MNHTFILFQDSVGPNNIPGYASVQKLAEYLVGLGMDSLCLTNSQVLQITKLWNAMDEYDRKPTTFQIRYSNKPATGKYRTTKTRDVVPGLDKTKRY